MLTVFTAKLTDEFRFGTEAPAAMVPFCASTVTDFDDSSAMVRVKTGESIPLIVSIRLVVILAITDEVPKRVNVPVLLLMITFPDTLTPFGRFFTVAVAV